MWRDIFSTVGVILSTVGDTQYRRDIMMHEGGYHEYHGRVFSTVGEKSFVILVPPTVLNTPHGTHDIPHMYHDIPHGTEHPPQYC